MEARQRSTCVHFTSRAAGTSALDIVFDYISPAEGGDFFVGSSATTQLAC